MTMYHSDIVSLYVSFTAYIKSVKMQINAKSTLYDSTSGNTGSAEAYMARLIGVPFVAVVGSVHIRVRNTDTRLFISLAPRTGEIA